MKTVTLILIAFLFLLFSCQEPPPRKVLVEKKIDFNDFKFLEKDISQIQQAYKDGNLTVKELVQAYLDRIETIDQNGPKLRSVIMVNPDAIQIAEELDKQLKEGKNIGPMFGVPVLLKDNINTHDKMPTTAGSRALKNSYPLTDSDVAKKLRAAGAVILGKTNLSEWANFRGQRSSSGWSGIGGQTKNPYQLDRNPCGSSSGSGVAVSANLCLISIGTETDGSIVCPASANGIVGIKPTVGLISRSGIIPISFTQDTPGPMARTVKDAAICLGTLVGVDSADSKTLESEEKNFSDYTQFLKEDGLNGKRIGYYKGLEGTSYKVDEVMHAAIEYIKSRGAVIVEIEEIYKPEIDELSFEIMLFEYKDGLNKYFQSLGPNAPVKSVQKLIDFNIADSVELDFYNQKYLEMAQAKGDLSLWKYRSTLANMLKGSREEGIDRVMNQHHLDAIIAPTGSPAWKTDHTNGDSYHIGSSSAAAQAGYPNISVPMGAIEGLPVGISFFGRAWSEPVLIEIAYSFEQGTKLRQIPQFLISEL